MEFNKVVGDVRINLSTDRIERDLSNAQDRLDMQVLADSNLYIPFQQGALKGSGAVIERGLIEWNVPYAHYQYMGELYLTEDGRSWAHKGEQKYPTGRDLQYHSPNTGAFWFEEAKDNHLKNWVDIVKREVKK